ncbi:DUF6059 family protein [Streptomyces sp. NPDC086554]|uniref:DUF6059 family protein n=1 Tax=Streptomyces sp. NPDC086554 TaxID=3154864 RepID=UPI00343A6314
MDRMRFFVRRCVKAAWRSLVAYGATQMVPPIHCPGLILPPPLSPPPAGGPERLVPDVPLTDVERSLAQELTPPTGRRAAPS